MSSGARIDSMARCLKEFNEFRLAGQYVDVVIVCENHRFACHRVILAARSVYFNTMFSSGAIEGLQGIVVLRGIKVALFQQVLEFIYCTEKFVVKLDNVHDLLQASEYFQLTDLEDECVQFVKNNRLTTEIVFDMFAFALTTNKRRLLRFLGDDIAAQLATLSRTNRFLEMSVDDLFTLFDLLPSSVCAEVQYSAVIRWVQHRPEKRKRYYKPIFSRYLFENLSLQYLQFIISNLYTPGKIPLTRRESSDRQPIVSVQRENVSQYIYVKNVKDRSIMIFSVDDNVRKERKCCYVGQMEPKNLNRHQWIRSVVMKDLNVYSLQYARQTHDVGYQSFTSYPSVSVHSVQNLKAVPLILKDVSMCAIQNNIYLYDRTLDAEPVPTLISSRFSRADISGGIYTYNCELDEWYPVPTMQKLVRDASMVNCGDVLYVVGGTDAIKRVCTKEFQAYDQRTGVWRRLPASLLSHHVGADCCVLHGKIYACGGSIRAGTGVVQRYDLTAGRWEYVASMEKKYRCHKVVSFANEIWAMGHCGQDSKPDYQTTIAIYNPNQNKWDTSLILTTTIQNSEFRNGTFIVVDSIVL